MAAKFLLIFFFATNAFGEWVESEEDMFYLLHDYGGNHEVTNIIPVGEDNEYIATFFKTWTHPYVRNIEYFRCVHKSITMERVGCWTLKFQHNKE